MKRAIRRIVNWAYGFDFAREMMIDRQAVGNLDILIRDYASRLDLEISKIKEEIDTLREELVK